jgi:glycerol uptake facilitator-like aquaporin
MKLTQKLAAEFIGTFWLVLAAAEAQYSPQLSRMSGLDFSVYPGFWTYCNDADLRPWAHLWRTLQSCCFRRSLDGWPL